MKRTLKQLTVATLTFLARLAIKRFRPRIIAVTGNVGKTSTKDAIYAVVASAFDTRKSEKSLNSEIGLPLAIFGLETAWTSPSGWIKNVFEAIKIVFSNSRFPEWLILEVGADHPGDIQKISKWLHPDIVILTRMSETPVHIEFFKSVEEVLKEKMFLAEALKPKGILVVNADDHMFMKASKNLPFRKVTYGKSKSADIKILESEAVYGQAPLSLPIGQYAVIDINGKKERIELTGVLGSHLMYPVAAASGVASILNIADDLPTVFSHLELSKGRMRLLSGKSKSIIIDDTYNSSPIASVEALRTLKGLSVRGRKIAALADMKELGDFSETAHMEIGKLAAECLHTLITVGSMSEAVSLGAIEAGMSSDRTRHFADSTVAAKAIDDIMRAGDVILVKGSQSMRMERIVSGLVEEGSNPKDLLVRQEVEWKNR